MKSKIPRTVKLDEATEGRLVTLLEASEKNGIKFPTVLNMALSQLLDRLDAGELIVFDGSKMRLSGGVHHAFPADPAALSDLDKAANQAADARHQSKATLRQPKPSPE